jgi:hypothetical protein
MIQLGDDAVQMDAMGSEPFMTSTAWLRLQTELFSNGSVNTRGTAVVSWMRHGSNLTTEMFQVDLMQRYCERASNHRF